MIDTLGGRKFLVTVASLLSCTGLMAFGRITDGSYGTVMVLVVAAYITGNVAARKTEGAKDGP